MPANHKVRVAWQILFTFLPIANYWAFYRIRKLTKYFFYVVLPSIAFSTVLTIMVFATITGDSSGFVGSLGWRGTGYELAVGPDSSSLEPGTYQIVPMPNNETVFFDHEQEATTNGGNLKPISTELLYGSYLVSGGLQAFAIYLVIIWSRQHNRQFEQSSTRNP